MLRSFVLPLQKEAGKAELTDLATEAAGEVLAQIAAESALDFVPGMALITMGQTGRRIWRQERRPWDRRRFLFAAVRVAVTGGI